MNEEERQLIALLQKQDKRAVSMLYDNYAPTLFGIILRIVHSRAIAEDVLQEAFVKAWQYGDRYNPAKGTVFTWLLNIARNKAIDKVRSAGFKRRKKFQPIDQTVADNERLSTKYDPSQIGLQQLVGSLEGKYQRVIELAYFQGFTQEEVSEYLCIPLGTVKSRIRIGLRELRKIFEEHNIIILWITTLNLFGGLGIPI